MSSASPSSQCPGLQGSSCLPSRPSNAGAHITKDSQEFALYRLELLPSQSKDNIEGVRLGLSLAHHKAGRLKFLTGDLGSALESLRESEALNAQLVEHDSLNKEWRRHCAINLSWIAEVLASRGGEADQGVAVAENDQAIVILRELLVADSESPDLLLQLANSLQVAAELAPTVLDAVALGDDAWELAWKASESREPRPLPALISVLLARASVHTDAGHSELAAESQERALEFARQIQGEQRAEPAARAACYHALQAAGLEQEARTLAAELKSIGYREPRFLQSSSP